MERRIDTDGGEWIGWGQDAVCSSNNSNKLYSQAGDVGEKSRIVQ